MSMESTAFEQTDSLIKRITLFRNENAVELENSDGSIVSLTSQLDEPPKEFAMLFKGQMEKSTGTGCMDI